MLSPQKPTAEDESKGVSGGIYETEWTFALTENAVQNGLDLYLNSAVTSIKSKGDFEVYLVVKRLCSDERHNCMSRYSLLGFESEAQLRTAFQDPTTVGKQHV